VDQRKNNRPEKENNVPPQPANVMQFYDTQS